MAGKKESRDGYATVTVMQCRVILVFLEGGGALIRTGNLLGINRNPMEIRLNQAKSG